MTNDPDPLPTSNPSLANLLIFAVAKNGVLVGMILGAVALVGGRALGHFGPAILGAAFGFFASMIKSRVIVVVRK